MKVGVPRETAGGERRVALVPDIVKRLAGDGFDVAVERGAGEAASFPDRDYEQAGAGALGDAHARRGGGEGPPPAAPEGGPVPGGPRPIRVPPALAHPPGAG